MTIRRGDIVTFKPEWRDAGDEKYTFVARSDEEKGRFDYSALELRETMSIWPVNVATAEWVECVSGHLNEDGSIDRR